MSREKELAKNTIVLSLGRFLPKLVGIVTLPIVTARLTKAEYGIYDFILTLVMLLLPIATLQIQSAAFRFLIDSRGNAERTRDIISNIFIVTTPISAVISLGIGWFFTSVSVFSRVAIGLYFFFDIIQITASQIARGLGNNKLYAINSIIMSVVNGVGIVIAVQLMDKGFAGLMFSLALSKLVSVIDLFVFIDIFKYIDLSAVSGSMIKELIAYSWPMIPNNLSNWVLKLSDRMVITALLGVEANAVYAVANKIPNLLSVAQSVFTMAWQENASIAVKDKDADKYYTNMFDRIFSLLIGSTALLIAFTPVMFSILIKGDYDDAYKEIPILVLGMFFYCMSAFQGGIYIAHMKTKSVGITTMGAAAINFLIDILFVKVIGITAGSVSTLVAYLALYVFRMINSLKFQKMDYNIKKQICLLLLIVVMLVLCFLRTFWIDLINMAFGVILFLILNRNMIRMILNKMLSTIKT